MMQEAVGETQLNEESAKEWHDWCAKKVQTRLDDDTDDELQKDGGHDKSFSRQVFITSSNTFYNSDFLIKNISIEGTDL